MKERFDLIRKTIDDLKNSPRALCDLIVYDEIDCQLQNPISDEDFEFLFSTVKNAYLKADGIDLGPIVSYCIDNFKDLKGMSSWDILEQI